MQRPFQTVSLQDCSDKRGKMKVLSCGKELPFDVKRAFFTYDSADASVRGNHAHVYSREAFICLQGSCDMQIDDGVRTCAVALRDPGEALIVEPLTWKKLEHYSADCILLVLSDHLYAESDYVRDYGLFLQMCKERKDKHIADPAKE